MKQGKSYFHKIDFVFYNAGKIRDAILEAKYGHVKTKGNGSGIGDPTASKALHDIMPIPTVLIESKPLKSPERWMRVVDGVYSLCDRDKRQSYVLSSKYGGISYHHVCQQLHISQSTHSKIWADVRRLQELCAVQEGLIKIF